MFVFFFPSIDYMNASVVQETEEYKFNDFI